MKKTFVKFGFLLLMLCLQGCRKAATNHSRVGYNNVTNSETRSRGRTDDRNDKRAEIQTSRGKRYDGTSIFKMYSSAVFMVFTSDGEKMYQGSGFFINDKGLAVSNYHVFEGTHVGAEAIKLEGSDDLYKLTEVIAKDKEQDFIIFKVNVSKSNYIPIAGAKPSIGEKVYAIGSPRGLENTFSSGEVSQWRDDYLMQINALIDHGSSGGALINEFGQVVGITSGSFFDGSQANLNYAWSIDVVKPYLNR